MSEEAFGSDCALLSATAGVALHHVGLARFAINLLPPSLIAARAEKAKIPIVIAAGVLFIAALFAVFMGGRHSAEVTTSVYEGVDAKVQSLSSYDKKVKKAQSDADAAQSEAETLRKLLAARTATTARFNAVRAALAPGMWIEKWEPGRVTIRGWDDSLQAFVEASARKNGGKRETASELFVARLKGSPVVEPESVKIAGMTPVGKLACVEQFVVELKFK